MTNQAMLQSGARNPHHRVVGEGSAQDVAPCHTHSKHSTSASTTRCPRKSPGRHVPRKAGQWFCAHHASTGAEPGVFRKYWSLIRTLSLSLSICLHLRTIPRPCQSCAAGKHACVQVLPCRWTLVAPRDSCQPQPFTREGGQLHQ